MEEPMNALPAWDSTFTCRKLCGRLSVSPFLPDPRKALAHQMILEFRSAVIFQNWQDNCKDRLIQTPGSISIVANIKEKGMTGI